MAAKKSEAGIGHNSNDSTTQQRLRSIVARIEKLNEDRKEIADDIGEVYAEAKGMGFDSKIIRQIIAQRKMDVEKRKEQEELIELYRSALGME